MELELVTRAGAFAGNAHRGQMRKEGSEPYINHPLRVAHACVLAGLPAEAVAAALLHDVVEDTPVGQEAIDAAFPARVAELVRLLTKWWPDDAPAEAKGQGKPVYYGAIAADLEALAVKLLDRADNLMSMVHMLPRRSDWARRYLKKTAAEIGPLAEACANGYACERFADALARLEATLAALG
ncbi:MAG: relA 1 [Cyanobacteria bacterium RYN_339]|nr:relA 1 [Cyanobacteria bacterium RYN_339]